MASGRTCPSSQVGLPWRPWIRRIGHRSSWSAIFYSIIPRPDPTPISKPDGSCRRPIKDAVGEPDPRPTTLPRGRGKKRKQIVALVSQEEDVPAKRNPYKPFLEMIRTQSAQRHVVIPVGRRQKRVEQVLCCKLAGCRYVAKTPTELKRHTDHHHNGEEEDTCEQLDELAPIAEADAFAAYDLGEAPPVLPQKGTKRKTGDGPDDVFEDSGSDETAIVACHASLAIESDRT